MQKLIVGSSLAWLALSGFLSNWDTVLLPWDEVPDTMKILAGLGVLIFSDKLPEINIFKGAKAGGSKIGKLLGKGSGVAANLKSIVPWTAPLMIAYTVHQAMTGNIDPYLVSASAASVAAMPLLRRMGTVRNPLTSWEDVCKFVDLRRHDRGNDGKISRNDSVEVYYYTDRGDKNHIRLRKTDFAS